MYNVDDLENYFFILVVFAGFLAWGLFYQLGLLGVKEFKWTIKELLYFFIEKIIIEDFCDNLMK